MIRIGQVVFSKKGRDKGFPFIVIDVRDGYVFLTDGKLRPLHRPKKKKLMHVQPTNTVVELSVFSQRGIQDADVRKLLSPFRVNLARR